MVIAHHGFDGLRLISDIWRGGLVGLVVRVRDYAGAALRRARRAEPRGRSWLYDVWQDVDDWLGERFAGEAPRGCQ